MTTAVFKLALNREGTNNEATAELEGPIEWLQNAVPLFAVVGPGIAKTFGFDRDSVEHVRREVDHARECLKRRTNYAGAFVSLTLKP